MEVKRVSIIGLGLIGGSLARALRERTPVEEIYCVNRNQEPVEQAVKDGVITAGFAHIDACIYDSDIIFICTPVKYAVEYIHALTGHVKPGCIITDVGSTKGEILDYVNNMPCPPCFVGGHPMAGTEKTGYDASFSHLFENAYYVLTPCKSSTDTAIRCMQDIVKRIGGIPVVLDAQEHDRVTAGISHVPHVIASALVNMVRDMDTPDKVMQTLAAGGFKDITRIASSSPEMWECIISSNARHVKDVLEQYIGILRQFIEYIDGSNSDHIYHFFESAREYRDTFSSQRKGLIIPLPEIIVDVVDRPGIIGQITTLLGENGINIKNINVSNSREFEQGCLIITLPESQSASLAYELLLENGYKAYKNN